MHAGSSPYSVLVGLDVRLQHCIDPSLIAPPLMLKPLENVRIKPQRDLAFPLRESDLSVFEKRFVEPRDIRKVDVRI